MKIKTVGAWLNESVARKIIFSLVVGTTFVLLVAGTSSLVAYRNYLIQQSEQTLSNTVQLLSSSLSIPVWGLDNNQILRIIDSVMLDQEIVAIKLEYSDELIFRGRSSTGIADIEGIASEQGSLFLESKVIHNNHEIGSLKLYYSNQPIKDKFTHFLIIFCLIVSVLNIALIIVSYLLLRNIVVLPLKSIKAYALNVMGVKTESPPQATYIGELSSLSNSIHEMVTLERAAREKVENFRKNLEKLVEDRTKQLKDRERELNRANVMAGIGHWKRDEATQQVTWSDQLYRIFGLEPKSVDVHPNFFWQFVHPDDKEAFTEHRGEMFKVGGLVRMDIRIITATQKLRWIHVEASGEFDDDSVLIGISGTVQDITERKKTEDNLIEAKKEAEAANKSKSTFLANMSHELRTPLNSIIGFSKMLLSAPLVPEQQKYVEIIHRAGIGLIELINDILNISKIEAGKEEVFNQSTHLISVVDDLIFMMASRAEHLPIKVVHDLKNIPPHVMLDQAKIRQVLINLVSNAIKFTRTGFVELSIVADKFDGETCELNFRVEDTGIGIAPADQQRVFQPFEQVTQEATNQGTGLGLTISKNLVALMGGNLELESDLGVGSKFYFSLRVQIDKSSAVVPIEKKAYAPIDTLALKVLIVDDVEEARLLLTDMMKKLGCQCYAATNGVEAREYFSEIKPDVALLDLHMPDISGLDLAAEFNKASNDMLILMQTADADSNLPQLAKAAGVDHLLTKPIQLETLVDIIFHHFNLPSTWPGPTTRERLAMPELTLDDLQSLSENLRLNLLFSLRGLNPTTIEETINHVRLENVDLAERLKRLVGDLQYRYIWDVWGI